MAEELIGTPLDASTTGIPTGDFLMAGQTPSPGFQKGGYVVIGVASEELRTKMPHLPPIQFRHADDMQEATHLADNFVIPVPGFEAFILKCEAYHYHPEG